MNVLWFSLRIDLNYPTQAFNQSWINEMAKKVRKIIVLTMYEGKHHLRDNVRVYSIGKEKNYSRLMRFFIFFRLLFKILKEEDINVVFSHMMTLFVAMSGIILKIKKIPVFLWYCHGHVNLKLRIAVMFSKKVYTCSEISMNVKTSKRIVVGHGIDTKKFGFSQKISDEDILLYVGRISPVKNISLLIDVAGKLTKEKGFSDLKLFIIGGPTDKEKDRKYLAELKNEIEKKKIGKSISFLGIKSQDELVSWYHRAKLYLNISDTGGLDKVILEAMACGCIPITSNTAFKEIYQNSFFQLIVSKDIDEIVDKIIHFLSTKQLELKKIKIILRTEVERNHSLMNLIDIFYEEMKRSIQV